MRVNQTCWNIKSNYFSCPLTCKVYLTLPKVWYILVALHVPVDVHVQMLNLSNDWNSC